MFLTLFIRIVLNGSQCSIKMVQWTNHQQYLNIHTSRPLLMDGSRLNIPINQDLVEDRMKNDLSHIEAIARSRFSMLGLCLLKGFRESSQLVWHQEVHFSTALCLSKIVILCKFGGVTKSAASWQGSLGSHFIVDHFLVSQYRLFLVLDINRVISYKALVLHFKRKIGLVLQF